jgi:flagellar protein FlgJ
MNVAAIQPKVDASHIAVENLAGNSALTEDEKIGEASRQFEAILLRQFLTEAQKPCFKSEFTDDSSEAGIYQDMVTNQLADALTRGNGVGLAQVFQHQLTQRHGADKAESVKAESGNSQSLLTSAPTK